MKAKTVEEISAKKDTPDMQPKKGQSTNVKR